VSSDFKKFWIGQTISNLGSSFTQWAIPLLVYQLTHSALSLGIATAFTFIPYLLFGLLIGAWMDRVDRKKVMIVLDSVNALVILSIPLVAQFGHLTVGWIYVVTFIQSTIFIAFSAGEFAAIPSLVSTDDLVTANGRIQATFSAAQVAGPLLAGALLSVMPLTWVMSFDSASFAVSALSLALVRASFNAPIDEAKEPTKILHDVREGLAYVLSHPVLRNISVMMALINFVGASTYAQLVLFADVRLDASKRQIGLLFAAGSAGVVVTGLLAGRLRRRFSFTALAMTSLMLMGLCLIVFAGCAGSGSHCRSGPPRAVWESSSTSTPGACGRRSSRTTCCRESCRSPACWRGRRSQPARSSAAGWSAPRETLRSSTGSSAS